MEEVSKVWVVRARYYLKKLLENVPVKQNNEFEDKKREE